MQLIYTGNTSCYVASKISCYCENCTKITLKSTIPSVPLAFSFSPIQYPFPHKKSAFANRSFNVLEY